MVGGVLEYKYGSLLTNKIDLWLRLKACHFNHLVPPHLWIKVTAAFGGDDASTKAFADKILC